MGNEKAIVCVPVADLIGQPLASIYPEKNSNDAYKTLSHCNGTLKNIRGCPRLHQLLYNDIVEIIKTEKEETCITISQAFHTTAESSKPQTTYWTLSSNIKKLNDVTHYCDPTHIPSPLTFLNKKKQSSDTMIITLCTPHYDPHTQLTFSAGTRFVRDKNYSRKKKIKVYAIDYTKNKPYTLIIPSHKCITIHPNTTQDQKIEYYLTILKKWIRECNGIIPYVWGGTSFTSVIQPPYEEKKYNHNDIHYSSYHYINDCNVIKSGFDCSGLILRAAQIAGIPYFYKNTTTIGQYLQPITQENSITNGDLIVIRGHVMVVSDVTKNMIIEARAYNHGYGKVHEIPLEKVFDGIATYADLCNAFFHKKSLKRKDIHGNIRDSFPEFKILTIKSAWR